MEDVDSALSSLSVGEILPAESLFTYSNGMSAASFSRPDHEPAFLDEVVANADPEIATACNNDPQCIFDYSETGSEEVGMATMMTNEENNMGFMQACESQ